MLTCTPLFHYNGSNTFPKQWISNGTSVSPKTCKDFWVTISSTKIQPPNLCRQELSVKVIFDNHWTKKMFCNERLPSVYYIKYSDLCVFIRFFFPLTRQVEELTYSTNTFTAKMCTACSVEIAGHLGKITNSLWVQVRDKKCYYIWFTSVAVEVKQTCRRGQDIFISALILLFGYWV